MRKFLLAAAMSLAASAAAAIPPLPGPPPPAPPPRLLIVIGVDHLAGDLWDEYRPQFTGGLARIARGTVFNRGYQSHAATETCPGYSTMLTGMRPARTGIIANHWIDQSVAKLTPEIYCAEDERSTPTSPEPTPYIVSPRQLQAPTLGDLLKASTPASRSIAVAGKDRAAVMLGGQRPDQRWFFAGTGFVTDLFGVATPQSVALATTAVQRSLTVPRPPLEPPAQCTAKARPYTLNGKIVGNNRFARGAGDWAAFRASPEYDAAVLALGAALIQELGLGRGAATDLLAIGLSGTDHVGHSYGTGGQEMCLQLLSLDRDLGDFFALLDRQGIDYAVALTADHGGLDLPARVPGASWVAPDLAAKTVGARIAADLGLAGPVLLGGPSGDVWLDRNLSPADRTRALDEALAIYRAHPQVQAVFTRKELLETSISSQPPDKWSLIERVRASFHVERSGDLVIVLKPNISPYAASLGIASSHGSPWDYDRRVPMVIWRPNALNQQRDEAIETTHLMPTLAAMLRLPLTAGSTDGRCIEGIQGIACPPR